MEPASVRAGAELVMSEDRPRHPLCITPAFGTPRSSQVEMIDRQATEILELKAKLEAAAGREHKANNRIQAAEGALEMIATLLGLAPDATPLQVVEAAIARLR